MYVASEPGIETAEAVEDKRREATSSAASREGK